MCLEYLKNNKDKKEFIKNFLTEDKDGYVTVHKEIKHRHPTPGYFSPFDYQRGAYKDGLNIAKRPFWYEESYARAYVLGKGTKKQKYRHGFYFLTEPIQDRGWNEMITCKIKKSWITSVGIDAVYSDGMTVVCKKAIFPKFPEVSA